MAVTRLGLHGSAAAYPGFAAKEAEAVVAASADVTFIVHSAAQEFTVPAEASVAEIP